MVDYFDYFASICVVYIVLDCWLHITWLIVLHGIKLFVIMVYILVGGLILQFMDHHHSVYFIVLMVYIHVVFICIVTIYIVYAYFFIQIYTSCFTIYQLCEVYPWLDGNIWGMYAYVLHHMQLNVCFEICYIV